MSTSFANSSSCTCQAVEIEGVCSKKQRNQRTEGHQKTGAAERIRAKIHARQSRRTAVKDKEAVKDEEEGNKIRAKKQRALMTDVKEMRHMKGQGGHKINQ